MGATHDAIMTYPSAIVQPESRLSCERHRRQPQRWPRCFVVVAVVFPWVGLLAQYVVEAFRVGSVSSRIQSTFTIVPRWQESQSFWRNSIPVLGTASLTAARKVKYGVPEYSISSDEDEDLGSSRDADGHEGAGAEFSDVENDEEDFIIDDTVEVESDDLDESATDTSVTAEAPKLQFAALQPGTVVHITVGQVRQARKAWKKRRRNSSPLLVPCSILHVDRASAVRWSCLYLLEKFGRSISNQPQYQHHQEQQQTNIEISLAELNQRYRTHLKSSLHQHALALGYSNSRELVQGLFHKSIQETYGVKCVEIPGSDYPGQTNSEQMPQMEQMVYLRAPLSRFKAQRRAQAAALLQVFPDLEHADTLKHTGYVRNKRNTTGSLLANKETLTSTQQNFYQLQPLSAALRIRHEDLLVDRGDERHDDAYNNDTEPMATALSLASSSAPGHEVCDGSMHAAVVLDYDPVGDGGAPLITLSLNPNRSQVRDRLKLHHQQQLEPSMKQREKNHAVTVGAEEAKDTGFLWWDQLQVGLGPIQGEVVRLIKNGALVDCNILSPLDDATGRAGSATKVLGFLRFHDTINDEQKVDPPFDTMNDADSGDEDNDDYLSQLIEQADGADDASLSPVGLADVEEHDTSEESEEDITHLFTINDDGNLVYSNPISGETEIMEVEDDGIDEELDRKHMPVDANRMTRLREMPVNQAPPRYDVYQEASGKTVYHSKWLTVGDKVAVYLKSVTSKPKQILLTMDSSVQGMKAKEIKQKSIVEKKRSRLAKLVGGLHRLEALQGQCIKGVVKATSNTAGGSWVYVQPDKEHHLPVGVATVPESIALAELVQGVAVQVQVEGIDENRGQLAMTVLKKLAP